MISPIPENYQNGWHGYSLVDLWKINSHFGTEDELKDLVEECHKNDIWVMLDVVANHVARVSNEDFSIISPFNKSEHYHNNCIKIVFSYKNK